MFSTVTSLQKIRDIRAQIILYKAYFMQCRKAMKEMLFLKLRDHQHFIDSSKLYTVQDLHDIHNGVLLPELEKVLTDYKKHQQTCEECSKRKFQCIVCNVPPMIDPLGEELFNIASCSQCHGVLHRACYNQSTFCPYCNTNLVHSSS